MNYDPTGGTLPTHGGDAGPALLIEGALSADRVSVDHVLTGAFVVSDSLRIKTSTCARMSRFKVRCLPDDGRIEMFADLGDGNDRFEYEEFDPAASPYLELQGEAGRDVLLTDYENDRVDGGPGSDLIRSRAGSDSIAGGPGRDSLFAGPDEDSVYGRDSLASDANKTLDCGPGLDFVLAFETDEVRRCEMDVFGRPEVAR